MSISGDDCKKVFELIGSIYFYGDFVAESYNEKKLEKILRRHGFMFETEDDLIKKLHTKIKEKNESGIIDKTGEPRSKEDLIEAREAIKKDLIDLKNITPILIYYPTIIEAINELIERRKGDSE